MRKRILTLFLLLPFCLAGCGDLHGWLSSGPVSWAIKLEARHQRSPVIEVASLTRFKWDELFLFMPYTPRSTVCERLTLANAACGEAGVPAEDVEEGEFLLVFRAAGRVVHVEQHPRWHGDFTPSVPTHALTPQTAVFDLVVKPGGAHAGRDWIELRLRDLRAAAGRTAT